jgi:hypothetical protein
MMPLKVFDTQNISTEERGTREDKISSTTLDIH